MGNTKCTRWAIWSLNEVIRTGGRRNQSSQVAAQHYQQGSKMWVSEWVQYTGQIIKKCFNECDLFECDWCLSTGGACDCSAHTSLVVISGAPSLSRYYVCFANSLLMMWAPTVCLSQCKYDGCYSSADLTDKIDFLLCHSPLRYCIHACFIHFFCRLP